MHWYVHALKNYAEFAGRACRTEFWTFCIINLLLQSGLEWSLGMDSLVPRLYALLVFVPTVAVSVRRLHDTSHSGWWVLLWFIPVLGWLALLVLMVLDSRPYMNAYGPNPKERADFVQTRYA